MKPEIHNGDFQKSISSNCVEGKTFVLWTIL